MSTYTLTIIDVRQVQRYLFNANELKQNLGASFLVEQATRLWIWQALQTLPIPHNWPDPEKDDFDTAKTVEGGAAEVIFSGGGNAAILFPERPQAVLFANTYTKTVLQNAPGLEVAIGHTPVNWDDREGMKKAWETMQEEVMPRRKEGRATSQALMGLGVTAECAFTGKPAVDEIDPDPVTGRGKLVSAEALAKRDHAGSANDRLRETLRADPFEYPNEFDDLGGERGRASYIAIVHADGNNMGKRIQAYLDKAQNNRDAVQHMRDFSKSANQAGMGSLKKVCEWLCNVPERDGQNRWLIKDSLGGQDAVRLTDLTKLPVRPLVYGGDDITLVCEGRLGLALTARLLEAFSTKKLADEKPVYACAGVAIVHAHYPFARAYALAENLCRAAKKQARTWDEKDSQISVLHWYFASAGRTQEHWDVIQEQEYIVPEGNMTLRPLTVTAAPGITYDRWRTWEVFLNQIGYFRGNAWSGRRNKIKDLRAALREGKNAVEQFTRLHVPLYKIPGLPAEEKTSQCGWYGKRCLYFDALEADDLFICPRDGDQP